MNFKKIFFIFFFNLSLIALLTSCTRSELKDKSKAMRKVNSLIDWTDDLKLKNFSKALQVNIARFKELAKNSKSKKELHFGPQVVSKKDYIKSLEDLLDVVLKNKIQNLIEDYIKENFVFYEVYGAKEWADVLVTSYYVPLIHGRRYKTKKYSQPIYGVPKDLVVIRTKKFNSTFGNLFLNSKKENLSLKKIIRARIVPKKRSGGLPEIVPYYSRKDLRTKKPPAKILAWVDPLEAFFLQIQGSGSVRFADGKKISLGYAAQNGHPYSSIGKYLFEIIEKEDMSLQTIEFYLRSLPRAERDKILDKNPSYVFFKKIKNRPKTYWGTNVVDGRVIASDKNLFPKGAMALLFFEKPIFKDKKDITPKSWKKVSRLIFDQDTGGAIRGAGHIDLFWGSGSLAKQTAGVMRRRGRLYYLVPRIVTAADKVNR